MAARDALLNGQGCDPSRPLQPLSLLQTSGYLVAGSCLNGTLLTLSHCGSLARTHLMCSVFSLKHFLVWAGPKLSEDVPKKVRSPAGDSTPGASCQETKTASMAAPYPRVSQLSASARCVFSAYQLIPGNKKPRGAGMASGLDVFRDARASRGDWRAGCLPGHQVLGEIWGAHRRRN